MTENPNDILSKIDGQNATQEKNDKIEAEELLNFLKEKDFTELKTIFNALSSAELLQSIPTLKEALQGAVDKMYQKEILPRIVKNPETDVDEIKN
jgi:Mg/Co/Ni transporter MgtE